MTPTTTRRLIALTEAAARLDVSTRTLRRYIAAGRLTGYRVGPRLIKIDPTELDRLLIAVTHTTYPRDARPSVV